ncbi:electron transporter, putative [Actinidia rufa]|uniref:Electron transporter, putative n=1 Tax=Actinidia rufa TaxID=165716 RepID=A0A7J0F5N5_9ERIC|nr:electron transporter, putative [Actinidia rufa]
MCKYILNFELIHCQDMKQDCVKTKKKQLPSSEVQNSLRQEPATELIKEIAVLEVEVVHLEQYLLSLYRKAFDQQISPSPTTKDERLQSPLTTPRGRCLQVSRSDITIKREISTVQASCQSLAKPHNESGNIGEEKLVASADQRCQSALAQRSVLSTRAFHPAESLGKAVRACHSQPLSMMEYVQNASSNVISLAEHLGTRISDHVPETPNKLSEDMIKCMSAIYCKLADPPLTSHGLSSPNSSLSSMSAFSPKDQCEMWSPGFRKDSSFDVRLDNPFHVDGLKEFGGPYSTMVEVPCLYRDSQKLGDVEDMLQNFRSLICRLEEVDPRKMKREEKLAFWINIHNALVMHAFLAYGIPQNNVKRVFLLLKAAYKVGGHIWLRLFLSSRKKFKTGDERKAYGIEHPEPLIHFALCSGSHSDPAVRVYTPKRYFKSWKLQKRRLCPADVIEMIQQCLPESARKSIKKCLAAKSHKSIEWVPYSFAFRYLIPKELVK